MATQPRFINGAVYKGGIINFRGKTAIVRIHGDGRVDAQFDDHSSTGLGYGWYSFRREDFEGLEEGDLEQEETGNGKP